MKKTEVIYVVFKTHFDIGFTGLASEVTESYQGSMLKSVLETCEVTAENEKGLKYIWTMSSWPFTKLLETPDKEMQKKALKLTEEGRLVWHALPFTTHTDFSGVEEFIRGLYISADLDCYFHKKTIAAKMTDVPGHTRMLPSILAKAGIKFLHIGCNACVNPPEVPRCFQWKGPDGGSVVTFYTKGGYGTDLIPPDDWEYPVWLALLNTNDNKGPHSAEVISDLVTSVEEKLPGTRVVVGTLDDFAEAFLACEPELPVIETDLADSWIHGVGTYPNEVSRIRSLRKAVMNIEGVFSLKALLQGYQMDKSVKGQFDNVYENILLFDEHTWGLDTKITLRSLQNGERVYDKNKFLESKQSSEYKRLEKSWREKAEYAVKAEAAVKKLMRFYPESSKETTRLCQEGSKEFREFYPEGKQQKLVVYNLLTWERDGEADVTDLAVPGEALEDSCGKAYMVYEQEGRYYVQLKSLPPMGCITYIIKKAKAAVDYRCQTLAEADVLGGAVLENLLISIKIDGKTGCITSFYDKKNSKEWAASGGNFGGYTYDIHGKERIIRYLKDYAYDFEWWYLADNGRPGYPWVSDSTFAPESCSIRITNSSDSGSVAVIWKMPEESTSKYGNASEVVMTVTLKENADFADITYEVNGKVETPFVESGHFIFPLNVDQPKYVIQKMGAVIDPATDIQYGANTSLYCCDKWMSVSDREHGISFFSMDTPLLSIGENRVYVYSKDYVPVKPVLYWNAFNNQWGTNFPQWIGGDFKYRFRIFPYQGDWKDSDIPKKAEEYATPLCPQIADNEFRLLKQDILNGTILCLKAAENGNGYVLRLQENLGETGEIHIILDESAGIYSRCNLMEEDTEVYSALTNEITAKTAPFEIHTFRILRR